MKLRLPYGSKADVRVDVPKESLLGLISPTEIRPSADPRREVEKSLRGPNGTPSLSEFAKKGKTVAIAVDDITRTTPTDQILAPLLDVLQKYGVKKDDITVLVALGTHRPITEREMKMKYGAEIVERYNVLNHAHDDESELKHLGAYRDRDIGEVPVWVNRHFLNADVRIATGNVIPHFNAGWGAGAKILLPGLAGAETVGRMHFYSAMTTPNGLGMHDNPTRKFIDSFTEKIGLHVIVNTVITRNREIVKVFSGHFVKAHREGVKEAEKVYGVEAAGLSDITISSSHPADIEFWQGQKGLFSADLATREGGGIVLATPCPEGVSVKHPKWADLIQRDSGEVIEMVRRGDADDMVAAGLALNVIKMRERHKIYIVSDGITERDAEKLRFRKFSTVQDAVDEMFRQYGRKARVNVFTHGGETYPIIHG